MEAPTASPTDTWQRTCAACGKQFTGTARAKFCSGTCRGAAFRAARAAEQADGSHA